MSSTHDSEPTERPSGSPRRRVLRKVPRTAALPEVRPPARRSEHSVSVLASVLAAGLGEGAQVEPAARGAAAICPPAPERLLSSPGNHGSHASMPPVTATLPPPSPPYALPSDVAPRASSWRGIVVGAAAGLTLVAAFVVGARVAHTRATVPASAVAALQTK